MCSCTRPFTPSSIAWAAFPTLHHTCVSGRSAWLTPVSAVTKSTTFISLPWIWHLFCVSLWIVHLFGLCCIVFRAVGGVVGHGDAPGSEDHHESGGGVFSPCVRPLRHAYRVHPTSHGRFISVPSRSQTSLVSLIVPTDLKIQNQSSVQEYNIVILPIIFSINWLIIWSIKCHPIAISQNERWCLNIAGFVWTNSPKHKFHLQAEKTKIFTFYRLWAEDLGHRCFK